MQFAHSTPFLTPPKTFPGTHIVTTKMNVKNVNKFIVETIKNINVKAINATLRMVYNVIYLIIFNDYQRSQNRIAF